MMLVSESRIKDLYKFFVMEFFLEKFSQIFLTFEHKALKHLNQNHIIPLLPLHNHYRQITLTYIRIHTHTPMKS